MENDYIIEMLNIRKEFHGLVANDNITLQLKRGEIHALLGENGAGKSTLMSVLFGLYQPEEGIIKKDGQEIKVTDPNVATKLHIGMVHQHFKLVQVFTVLQNIILGDEIENGKFIKTLDLKAARKKVMELSEKYGLNIDPDAKIEDISVGMQQRTEILKMLYRDNEVLIFDEPTAVLTPQEIKELMQIMKNLKKEGKSILFITHKLNEIKEVADRCTVLRKGKYIGTVDVKDSSIEDLSTMMVGRKVQLNVNKTEAHPKEEVLRIENLSVKEKIHNNLAVKNVSFNVRKGEIVCIAGIDGNGQTELIYGITGLYPVSEGNIYIYNEDITNKSIRQRNLLGISHIPEDRHKHGLVLDFSLENNLILQSYFTPRFQKYGFIKFNEIRKYADELIDKFDIRSSQGATTSARSMSGGNQQKAIIAREVDRKTDLLIAVQPTRGLDVGAIENVHDQLIKLRDDNKAILMVSLELSEVMSVADRIIVIHDGELVGEFKQGEVTQEELGLYMAGAKRNKVNAIK